MSNPSQLEQQFEAAWRKATEQAAQLCALDAAPILAAIEKKGGASAAHETLRRGVESPLFAELCQKGHPELSMEALVTQSRFADLFSDREVNLCLDRLCEVQYFG